MNIPIKYLDRKGEENTYTTLFLFNKGRVLYGLRHHGSRNSPKHQTTWTTPGGRCKKGETIEDCIKRVLEEETGIPEHSFSIRKFLGVIPGSKAGDKLFVYQGTTSQEPALTEPDRFDEWRWFNPKETPPNFINPMALRLLHQSNLG